MNSGRLKDPVVGAFEVDFDERRLGRRSCRRGLRGRRDEAGVRRACDWRARGTAGAPRGLNWSRWGLRVVNAVRRSPRHPTARPLRAESAGLLGLRPESGTGGAADSYTESGGREEGSGYQNECWKDRVGHTYARETEGQREISHMSAGCALIAGQHESNDGSAQVRRVHARARCGARRRLAPSPSQKAQPSSADAAVARSAVQMSTARMRRTPRPSPTRQGQRAEA